MTKYFTLGTHLIKDDVFKDKNDLMRFIQDYENTVRNYSDFVASHVLNWGLSELKTASDTRVMFDSESAFHITPQLVEQFRLLTAVNNIHSKVIEEQRTFIDNNILDFLNENI
jgi:hypothetical protein